ncbi:hypothetical protein [Siphonobacter sp. SORGH_AS_0500]|uniref:hypothetical protein n=1 Tax=Siphonobacter sp. SORGH_AS_0500 TaxID=1864824 RepID=UPI0012FEC676|nr:hypothetical protein [Siphonobacter sp. SORGH_AS_0500]
MNTDSPGLTSGDLNAIRKLASFPGFHPGLFILKSAGLLRFINGINNAGEADSDVNLDA